MAIFFNDTDGRAGIEQFRYVSDIVSDIDPALGAELETYGSIIGVGFKNAGITKVIN